MEGQKSLFFCGQKMRKILTNAVDEIEVVVSARLDLLRKAKALLKKGLMFFQRDVAKFSQTLDFFPLFLSRKRGILLYFFTKNLIKPQVLPIFARKNRFSDASYALYLRPRGHLVKNMRFSRSENANFFDKM